MIAPIIHEMAPMIAPIIHEMAPMIAPIIHESNETGEICDNKKEDVIIYNIGDEYVEECIHLPLLEEPVIETLSKSVEANAEQEVVHIDEKAEALAEAHAEQEVVHIDEKAEAPAKILVEDTKKKNKNKKKNTRK